MKQTAKGKLNYKKGLALENEFSNYMLEELKYDSVQTRKSVSGKDNVKGVQADIIGLEKDDTQKKLRKASLIFAIAALFGIFLIMIESIPTDLIYLFFTMEAIAIIYLISSKDKGDKYTWVECKDHSSTINIKVVRDFFHEVEDHNLSSDRKFNVDKMIFVSSSGFVDNALEFAASKNIVCYKKTDGKFEKVNRWKTL